MRHTDFSPFYRSAIGFDRLFKMLDDASGYDSEGSYPPYNIEKTGDDSYRISLALAGFKADDLNIEVKEQTLTISGEKKDGDLNNRPTFLHRGIATRAFERRFQLADHVEVTGADYQDGMLHVELVRNIPERMKSRTIAISSGNDVKQIETSASAH